MACKGILWLRLLQICFAVKFFDGLLLVGRLLWAPVWRLDSSGRAKDGAARTIVAGPLAADRGRQPTNASGRQTHSIAFGRRFNCFPGLGYRGFDVDLRPDNGSDLLKIWDAGRIRGRDHGGRLLVGLVG